MFNWLSFRIIMMLNVFILLGIIEVILIIEVIINNGNILKILIGFFINVLIIVKYLKVKFYFKREVIINVNFFLIGKLIKSDLFFYFVIVNKIGK